MGPIDAVLLSHDHHFDNLDHAGRALLPSVRQVVTTPAGAERLGGNALGLTTWASVDLSASGGQNTRVTSTPARHGPADGDRGPVTGFLLTEAGKALAPTTPAIYVSGDTVWYEGLRPIAERAEVKVALLFLGAARLREVGPAHLTFAASEGVAAARAFPRRLGAFLRGSGGNPTGIRRCGSRRATLLVRARETSDIRRILQRTTV